MESRLIKITCISYFSFTEADKSNDEPNEFLQVKRYSWFPSRRAEKTVMTKLVKIPKNNSNRKEISTKLALLGKMFIFSQVKEYKVINVKKISQAFPFSCVQF